MDAFMNKLKVELIVIIKKKKKKKVELITNWKRNEEFKKYIKKKKRGTEFGYKPVYSQLTTIHYVATNKIIYVYF